MSDARCEIRNLTLAGFMGTGKSTVGRLAAGQLGYRFVDTDEAIEAREGRRVSEIFAQDGEARFRELERRIVLELEGASMTVIAAGGGLVAQPGNLESLRRHSLVICLWASPERIWERVRHQSHRPLLEGPDPLGKIRRLLEERREAYRSCDVLLHTDFRSPRAVAAQVLHHFHRAPAGVA